MVEARYSIFCQSRGILEVTRKMHAVNAGKGTPVMIGLIGKSCQPSLGSSFGTPKILGGILKF